MTQLSDFCSMQQDAQRRVYEMQQRANRALGAQATTEDEQSTPMQATVDSRISSCDSEKLLIMLLLILISREQSSTSGLMLALLYLCI